MKRAKITFRLTSGFLVICLVFQIMILTKTIVYAQSADGYVSYVKGLVGSSAKEWGDGSGTQCVELPKYVLDNYFGFSCKSIGLGNGNDFYKNVASSYPDLFTRIDYYDGFAPQPGDIISYHDSSYPTYGHVAIVYAVSGSSYTIAEQWKGSGKVLARTVNIIAGQYGVSYSIIGVARFKSTIDVAEGVYVIRNVKDNSKVLDIQGDSKENKANIQLFDNLHNDVQKFKIIKQGDYYLIQSVYSGLWLDIAYSNGYGEPGKSIQLYNSHDNEEEHWVFEDAGNGNVYIKSLYGVYVDTGGPVYNNTNIITYQFDGTLSQQWTLVPVAEGNRVTIPDGIYNIQLVKDPNKVIDIQNNSTESQARLIIFDKNGENTQKFRVINRDGYCSIQSVYSGYWLDTASPFNTQGAAIQLYGDWTQLEEKWIFDSAGNGNVFIRSYYDVYIDTGGPVDTRTPLQAYHYDGTQSQQWKFIEAEHSWNSGVVTAAATYFKPGVKTYTCTTCGTIKTEQIPVLDSTDAPHLVRSVDYNGHTYYLYASNYDWTTAKGWCEAYGGYLATITSAAEQNVINQLIGEDSQTSFWLGAENETTGSFRWITCENWTYKNWQTGEPSAPDYETCLGTYLGTAWNDFNKGSVTPKGFIIEKGDIDESKKSHLWNSGNVTITPTCTSNGVKAYTCSVCGVTKAENIAALGHNWGAWANLNNTQHQRVCLRNSSHMETESHTWNDGTVTTAPTCTAAGIKTYTCTVCQGTKTQAINATGHSWNAWESQDDIYHRRVCENDPSHTEQEEHEWDEGVITKEPSATEAGTRTYHCTVCNAVKDEDIPAIDPQYTAGDINGDGVVNNKDLTRLMKYLSGEDVEVTEAALDVNGDGTVNNKDLTRLMKYLAGEDVQIN